MTVAGIGSHIEVTAVRDSVLVDYRVAMVDPPELPPRNEITLDEADVLVGMTVANVNPAVLAEYRLPILPSGVVVLETGPIGPRIGVQRGDIMREIDGVKIVAPSDVKTALSSAQRAISIVVERGGQLVLLSFRI